MNNEGISSLAVIDHQLNVVGNISTVDVKVCLLHHSISQYRSQLTFSLAKAPNKILIPSSPPQHLPPLHLRHTLHPRHERRQRLLPCLPRESTLDPCSYGRQARGYEITPVRLLFYFPVLYYPANNTPFCHRMWITDPQSPSSSGPPTPSLHSAVLVPQTSASSTSTSTTPTPPLSATPPPSHTGTTSPPQSNPPVPPNYQNPHHPSAPTIPHQSPTLTPTISASSLPGSGARLSGHLVGVVSLTDILNLYARASGLHPSDPNETRKQRRRSSSSSIGVRRSGEVGREMSMG